MSSLLQQIRRLQQQAGAETKTETTKPQPAAVTVMKLREASYVYRDPDERSQRTWMLKENTELTVTPGQNGWVAVQDRAGRQGLGQKRQVNKP
jgi:hypothetical protein